MALNHERTMLLPLSIMAILCLASFLVPLVLIVVLQQAPAFAQACRQRTPYSPVPRRGVDSAAGRGCGEVGWDARGMIPWQEFAQGEYVGHARTPHVPEYRIRESDV